MGETIKPSLVLLCKKDGSVKMNDKIEQYIDDLTQESSPIWVEELEAQAFRDNIPIMEQSGIRFLKQLIRIQKPKRILEIGTAIGYSALQMADACLTSEITSIERDEHRYKQAVENVKKFDKEQRIDIIYGDALEVVEKINKNGYFDLLFIDAAKGQYQRFFEMYTPLLNDHAVIVTDNVLFKGYVAKPNKDNKRIQKIAGKIHGYNEWLVNHKDYHTIVLPIGDGIAITTKRLKG